MKNTIKLITSVILIISLLCCSVSAALPPDNYELQFEHVMRVVHDLRIDDAGNALLEASVDPRGSHFHCRVVADLMYLDHTTWALLHQYVAEGSPNASVLIEDLYLPRTRTYQCKCRYYVYNENNVLVESITKMTPIVYALT